MKKLFLLLGIGICWLQNANAQWITGGSELGMNFSTLHMRINGVNDNTGTRVGPKIGGVLDIGLTRHFSIQPGLFYSAMGAHDNYVSSSTNDGGVTTTNEVKNDYRIDYMQIPVNFQFRFGTPLRGHFFFGGGPYFAFAMGGKVTNENITIVNRPGSSVVTTDRTNNYNLRIGNNANRDDIRGGDMGMNLDLGYELPMGLFFRGNFGIGFANILPGGDMNNYMHNGSFTLSVGYMFGH